MFEDGQVVSNLENIHKYAKPDEVETAREALKGIIGQVTVAEEKHHVVAYPMLGNNVVYNSGAQNALPDLYIKRIKLK